MYITNIYSFNCRFYHNPTTNFTFKSHFLLLKIITLIEVSQVVLVIPVPSFLIPHDNTMMHDYTNNIYCYHRDYFTVCEL